MRTRSMGSCPYHPWDDYKYIAVPQCILPLSNESPKGSSGRVAVLGGSPLHTGAAYFAGMASLRTGAEMISLYTSQEAALPLKSYTPEFMVQSVYTAADLHSSEKIHCLVIGPDMGVSEDVLIAVAHIIYRVRRELAIYLVLDSDAFSLFSEPRFHGLLKGYEKAILAPNALEYERLMNQKSVKKRNPFESVTIVQNDFIDQIWYSGKVRYQCGESRGAKRCRHIGDILAGTIGTLVAWQAIQAEEPSTGFQADVPLACWTACCIVKRAMQQAFAGKKRAMSAQDVLDHLGPALEDMIR